MDLRLKSAGLVASGLVAGVVLAGLTVADAQTPVPTPSASAEARPDQADKADKAGKPGRPDKHKGSRGHGLGGLKNVLHGEAVVRAPGGGYRTLATQLGTVTALTPESVAVRSEDGFARTYARTAGTRVADGVAVGDTVRVVAEVENGAARALHVKEARGRDGMKEPKADREPEPSAS